MLSPGITQSISGGARDYLPVADRVLMGNNSQRADGDSAFRHLYDAHAHHMSQKGATLQILPPPWRRFGRLAKRLCAGIGISDSFP
jgi:hypothetical protein